MLQLYCKGRPIKSRTPTLVGGSLLYVFMIFIYTTCKDMDEAKKLGELIISNKNGACVDFWPISSCYNWEGTLTCVDQVMLLITTLESKLDEVNTLISDNHTYSIPLIAGVDIRRINHPYKEWMVKEME